MALRKEKGGENGFSSPFYAFLSAMRFSRPFHPPLSASGSVRGSLRVFPQLRVIAPFSPLLGESGKCSIVESEIQQWMRMFWYCADVCY